MDIFLDQHKWWYGILNACNFPHSNLIHILCYLSIWIDQTIFGFIYLLTSHILKLFLIFAHTHTTCPKLLWTGPGFIFNYAMLSSLSFLTYTKIPSPLKESSYLSFNKTFRSKNCLCINMMALGWNDEMWQWDIPPISC